MFGRLEGCLGLVETIVESTDLLYVPPPRQIDQSEEAELQEGVPDQRRCEIERASPAFHSDIDEAERGDESQEGDCDPDEDELDQGSSYHCRQRSASFSTTTV